MNQMVKGDNIQVVSTSGEILNYNVISTSIVPGTVTNVMKPSDKNYLKIVTCGTETGDPGSDQYRVVVLAELQN
jgi:sortase (surface protein transpeptidase)